MKINKLNLISFGKFKNKELLLKEGLNVIYGKNEAGKSTISAFIRFMLYSLPREKASKYNPVPDKDKFMPWSGEAMEGTMEVSFDGRDLLVTKNQKKTTSQKVIDSITGEEQRDFNGPEPGNIFFDADSSTFDKTAFIRQNELEVSTSSELESRLRNLVSGGEEDISYNDARARLESAIKKIDRPNAGLLTQVQREIYSLEEKLLISQKNYDEWLKIEKDINTLISDGESLKNKIEELNKRYLGQLGFQAKERLAGINECEAYLSEYKERLKKIDDELSSDDAIIDESFLKEGRRLISDLRILTEKQRLLKEDLKVSQLRIREKEEKLLSFSKISGNEDKITEDLKKASKTRNRVLLFIGALLITAAVVSLFGAFIGISFNLYMFIIGCACGVGGLTLLIIYRATRKRARADRIAFAYGCFSADELLTKIEEIKGIKKELDLLENEFSRHKEREENEERILNEVKLSLDKMGSIRGIDTLSLSGAELMCGEIETLLQRRQSVLNSIELYENKIAALTLGTDKVELENQARQALEENDSLNISELLEEINKAKDSHKEKILEINSLKYKQKELIKNTTPDEIMTEIISLKEKRERIIFNRSALEKALKGLNSAFAQISMVFAPKLCNEAGKLFNSISRGERELLIDSSNNVKVLEEGRIKELDYFSTGTKDAVFISVRLAICRLIFKDKTPPVIFDDTFAHFDIDRLKNAMELLKEISKENQIIFFTCREEEVKLCRDFANIIEL